MWIEILRTGTFTDSAGRTQNFTAEDLDHMIQLYNEKTANDESFRAPLVKGHPESNSPAYGWIERLARRGNVLYAKLKSLSQEIIDEVREGKFRKVSISLYPDFMLRHVGLLGGVPPAVKGLRPVQFEEFDDSRCFEYPTENEIKEYEELRHEIQTLVDTNAQLSRQNQSLRSEIEKLNKEVRTRLFREFAENLCRKDETAILPPSKTEELVEILELSSIADDAIDRDGNRLFAEGVSLTEKIKKMIQNLRPTNVFEELRLARSKYSELIDEKDERDDFRGRQVDERRLLLHRKARKILEQSPNLSYEEALRIAFKNLKIGGNNGNN